ncbi:uncharacterized protein LOC129971585 [Argiope bruennichi]|uniref:uncharacterized protein LOC129971585 n=1 Tax=Argiope bruennichi TaxID=94029 RepID=UPI00249482E2|nr:uncharacterized protein LOC129971585 [Argiope bruennichi]
MKIILFLLLFLIIIQRSTPKRLKRKVAVLTNSSNVQNVNINCHNCRRAIQDSEGFITSVSNASTYFQELIYGWTIEVPMHHDIFLSFWWPTEAMALNESSTCGNCKPYFEIIYGYSSSESTFKIEKFYNIRQLANLSVPSHKTEIRFYSGVQCNESRKLGNADFSIHFKAIPFETEWSMYTLFSVLIPAAFVFLGIAYFCVIMKKKEEQNQDALTLPIPIYVDLENSGSEFKKCKINEKQNRGRGLRLRTHHSSQLEEPKEITVISSLVEGEASESSLRPEELITPDSSNPVPVKLTETKKHFVKKRLPPKVNLLNRFTRSAASTPRYASFYDEAYNEDRLSKSDIVIFEKRKVSREKGSKIFNFDVLPGQDTMTQPELETSVFLHSSSASSNDGLPNESNREFVSPK